MRVVILLVFCYHAVSQPITEDSKRLPRELIECCPCPGSSRSQDLLRSRASDDCPCRVRGADSEGASSMLFPSAVRSDRPLMRSNDIKDDQKNLLEPEVGLATSMLQTLKEATEEEYQDALARDAARNADAVPEESVRNVVIIVKPKTHDDEDELISEASNVKETRCIQPLGTSLGRMRSPSKPIKVLPDIFRLPSGPGLMHRSLWDIDSNVGASNAQESVVDIDGNAATAKPRTPLFKPGTLLRENTLKGDNLKTSSVIEKLEQSLKNRPNLFERFNLPAIPKLKLDGPLRKDNKNNDLNPAPSNIDECTENERSMNKGPVVFKNKPLMLKNLLKLKDVELIPKTIPKRQFLRSKSIKDLPSPANRDVNDNSEDSTYDSAMNEKVLLPNNIGDKNVKASNLPAEDADCSDIDDEEANQDAITSPSEVIPTIIDNTETKMAENEIEDCDNLSLQEEANSPTENTLNVQRDDDNDAEVLDPVAEQIPIKNLTENEEDERRSNIDTNFENESTSEDRYLDSETDSSNIIESISSLADTENPTPLSNRDDFEISTIDAFDSSEEVIASDTNAQDKTPRESSIPLLSDPVIPEIQHLSPLSETLANIKEQVNKKIENLNKASMHRNTDTQDARIVNDADDSGENRITVESIEKSGNAGTEESVSPDKLTFEDLQKLSDDLLVLSTNKEQNSTPKIEEPREQFSKFSDTDFKAILNGLQESNDHLKQDTLKSEADDIDSKDSPTFKEIKSKQSNGCRSDLVSRTKDKTIQETKSVSREEEIQEMAVAASSPITSSLPVHFNPLNLNEKLGAPLFQEMDPLNLEEKLRSPLFKDLDPLNLNLKSRTPIHNPLNLNEKLRSSLSSIVQPSIPEDPLNLLGKPLNNVLKLPSLEDLRQRLSSVFEINDRKADGFSDENGDFTNNAPVEMASAASTIDLRKLPSIKPLEDVNVDIFQLSPLSSSQSDFLSKAPRLNMNNFRAKLPIPNNLDLKPVKLESRVGNDKGILGASLSFGQNKASSRKAKPLKNHLNLHPLEKPLGALSSLDELRNSLHSGTQNLLGNSLQPSLGWLRDSDPIGDIDSIRRNAEKTMKGLQQRMKSTFNGGKISSPLGEKFARPQDLLEDVNDKLKAIHYDLNDRLSSIHEDFLDQARLKPLISPRIPTLPSRNSNSNVMTNFRKLKGKPARLQTSASTLSSQEFDPFDAPNNRNLMRSQPMINSKRVHDNLHRNLDGAESAPVPTKVEFPKPKYPLDFSKNTIKLPSQRAPTLRQNTENIFPQNILNKPLPSLTRPSLTKDIKRPVLRKQSPFKDKKVTITFATTTASPVPTEKYRTKAPTIKATTDISKYNSELKDRLAATRPKLFRDTKTSPSETTSRNAEAPLRIKNNFKTASSDFKNIPQLQSLEPTDVKSRFSGFKERNKEFRERDNNRLNDMTLDKPEVRSVEATEQLKPLVWPKSTEDSFLAKVKEAMQARLASFDPTRSKKGNIKVAQLESKLDNVENIERPQDMTKAASENDDVLFEEPLKENVSYRCKMVCTREE